jgi:hypothetical protein
LVVVPTYKERENLPKRPFWSLTTNKARAHARIAAVVLWVTAVVILVGGTTYRDPLGQLKWTDFVFFYTLGHLARNGPVSDLYNPQTLYEHQIARVPASAPEHYFPVYPPQVALVFAPLANLPYHVAALLWALVNIVVYGGAVYLAWRPMRRVLAPYSLVGIAAAAFPPFWNVILHGQTTGILIIAFGAGTIAMAHGRKRLAGLALGLLLIKPQFGLALAVVVLTCGEWSILAGLILSACIQALAVAGLLGPTLLFDYLHVLPRIAAVRDALEPSVAQLHSLAVLTRLLPGYAAPLGWLAASAVVCWMTVRVWRSPAPVSIRMGALVIGSTLVNPHLIVYDAAVIAAPLVSLSGWLETKGGAASGLRRRWYLAIYALYVLLFFPTARFMAVQLSPLVLLFLMHTVWQLADDPSLDGSVEANVRVATVHTTA